MRTVIITGHRGFLGRHAFEYFASRGWRVSGFDLPHDLRTQGFGKARAELVLNFAAEANPEKVGAQGLIGNMEIARTVAKEAFRIGARVLQISSAEVYGPGWHDEQAPIRPLNYYAASKAVQDAAVLDHGGSVVVTQNLFGQYQQPGKFVPYAVSSIKGGISMGVQPSVRRWLHADQLANALMFLADRSFWRCHVAGTALTPGELFALLNKTMNGHSESHEQSVDRLGHEGVYCLRTDLIESMGWKPSESLEDSLRRTAAAL